MKKTIAIMLALLIAATALCACSPTKLLEKAIKKETGQDIKIDKDGDTVTLQDKDGESVMISSGDDIKWPADKMGRLPELKGNITSALATDKGCVVLLDNVNKADAEAYIQKLKDMNLTEVTEMTTDLLLGYSGTIDNGQIAFTYYNSDEETGSASISYGNSN